MRRDGRDDRSLRGATLVLAGALLLATPVHAVPLAETVAGGGTGDGQPATAVAFSAADLAVAGGNVVLADTAQGRLRRVDAVTGRIGAFPAPGVLTSCNAGPITDTCLFGATSLAVAPDGDVLVADLGGRVLRVDAGTGAVTRIAGRPFTECGNTTTAGASVLGPDACLADYLSGIAVDAGNNVFIAEGPRGRIRRVDAATGMLTTVAGIDALEPACSAGAIATTCALGAVFAVALDSAGNLYLAQLFERRVLKVDAATGRITTVVGGTARCKDTEGVRASRACTSPLDVAVDSTGATYVLERDGRIRRVDPSRRARVTTLARVPSAVGLALDAAGRLFVLYADKASPFATGASRIARLDPSSGALVPVAGNGSDASWGDGGPAAAAGLDRLQGIAVAPDGGIVLTELGGSNRVRRIDSTSTTITTIGGDGTSSSGTSRRCPDGVPATASCFNQVGAVAVDAGGHVFVVDSGDAFDDAPPEPSRLRRIDAVTGLVSTVMEAAGCGWDSREDVPASEAPCVGFGIAADGTGNLYLTEGERIRRIDGATGRIRTIAGNGNFSLCGDGGLATRACIWATELAVDPAGNVFFIDDGYDWRLASPLLGSRIRRIDAATGLIATVAGNGEDGFCGDGGPAVAACLSAEHLALDRDGAVLVTTYGRIRRIDPRTGVIDTIAGDPNLNCLASDGSAAFDACVGAEALDGQGRALFLVRSERSVRVRRVTLPCGDGVIGPGETCDDGNRVAGDGCDPNCTPTGCGNGIVTTGEGCDDGTLASDDCCDAACQPRTGATCDDASACTAGDVCDAGGRCTATARVACDAGPCATSACDPATGTCVVTTFPSNLPPFAPVLYTCDDSDPCTIGHACVAGVCSPGFPLACNDNDPCTLDAEQCVPGVGCTHTPLTGKAATVCRCAAVFAAPRCNDEERLPRALVARVKHGCDAIARALALPPGSTRAPRAAARAARRMEDVALRVQQAAGKGFVGSGCAESVVQTLADVIASTNGLAAGVP